MTSLSTLGHAERSRWSAFNLQQVLCDDVGEQPESCTKSLECCSLDFRNKYADSIILLGRSSCAPQRRSRLASAPSSSERCYLQRRSSNETTSVQHNDLFIRNHHVLPFEDGPGHATFLTDIFRAFNDHMRHRRHWTSESHDLNAGDVIMDVAPNTCLHPCVVFMQDNLNWTWTANWLVRMLSLSNYRLVWRPV